MSIARGTGACRVSYKPVPIIGLVNAPSLSCACEGSPMFIAECQQAKEKPTVADALRKPEPDYKTAGTHTGIEGYRNMTTIETLL